MGPDFWAQRAAQHAPRHTPEAWRSCRLLEAEEGGGLLKYGAEHFAAAPFCTLVAPVTAHLQQSSCGPVTCFSGSDNIRCTIKSCKNSQVSEALKRLRAPAHVKRISQVAVHFAALFLSAVTGPSVNVCALHRSRPLGGLPEMCQTCCKTFALRFGFCWLPRASC